METSKRILELKTNRPEISGQEIAKALKISESLVSKHLRAAGYLKIKSKFFRTLTKDQLDSICRRYDSGESMAKLAIQFTVGKEQIRAILGMFSVKIRLNRKEYQKFKFDEFFFDDINTEQKAYFLGLIYADGNISGSHNVLSIGLQERDGYILTEMSKIIAFGSDITRQFKVKRFNGIRLKITSSRIKNSLIKLGCMPNKSMKIRMPTLSSDMMPHFFRGYFDGDGCFSDPIGRKGSSNRRGIFKIVSNTEFCNDLSLYLREEHGIEMGVYHPSPNKMVGALQSGNDQVLKFLYNFMYLNSTIFLRRKKDKIESYLASK